MLRRPASDELMSDCASCVHRGSVPAGGGHCVMHMVEPEDHCSQWRGVPITRTTINAALAPHRGPCSVCGRAGDAECGRVTCGNRHALTAGGPSPAGGHDGYTSLGASGCYKRRASDGG